MLEANMNRKFIDRLSPELCVFQNEDGLFEYWERATSSDDRDKLITFQGELWAYLTLANQYRCLHLDTQNTLDSEVCRTCGAEVITEENN
jgi:hypothetical protein